jgi:lipopolysaccharide transport system permease protein
LRVLNFIKVAGYDILSAFNNYHLFLTLGWQDVATKYRRSRIGAFWITIGMSVSITTMGVVFGQLFEQPMAEFLPFVSIGSIFWGFFSSNIGDGCNGFIAASGIILQVRMPLFVHVMRVLWRNMIILAHNIMIIPVVFLFFSKPVSLVALLAIPGFILFVINLSWMMLVLSVVCARYRDFPPIVINAVGILFFLTPIMWNEKTIPDRANFLMLNYNPFYHLISIVRAPLLGDTPTVANWVYACGMGLVGWSIALIIFGRYRNRIPYWL